MKTIDKKLSIFLVLLLVVTMVSSCNSSKYAQTDTLIISAKSLTGYIGADNVVIIDMQSANDYAARHVPGAVNITKADIVVNEPVSNMLAPASTIEQVLGSKGISNDTTIVVYDSDNMSASRMVWTLFMYGDQNVKLVDGGIKAIQSAGIEVTKEVPTQTPATFRASYDPQWLATKEDVLQQVNNPDANVILLDVRTNDEYVQSGKVPSSVMFDYYDNFYADGTFKDTQTTQINYLKAEIRPENDIILYCQTSMRAAAVFVRLYDAGYRNLKVYDGAYAEWVLDPSDPVVFPDTTTTVTPSQQDAS
ncbi:MAG: sulfurtransferase [Anaerofustis sp.]